MFRFAKKRDKYYVIHEVFVQSYIVEILASQEKTRSYRSLVPMALVLPCREREILCLNLYLLKG